MVNLGYSYRNSIYTLLYGEEKIRMRLPWLFQFKGLRCLFPAVYILGALCLYIGAKEPEQIMLLGVLGNIGLCGSIDKVVLPWLENGSREAWSDQGEKLVYMGFFREDLKMAKLYIILFISTADILCCLVAGMIHQDAEFVLCMLSFASMIPLLAMSLMFRFATEAAGRRKQMGTLGKIGYTRPQIRRIVRRELQWLYGFIMVSSLVYIVGIVVNLSVQGLLPVMAGTGLVMIFVISLIVCGLLNYRYNSTKESSSTR